jgi:hypothetical protein
VSVRPNSEIAKCPRNSFLTNLSLVGTKKSELKIWSCIVIDSIVLSVNKYTLWLSFMPLSFIMCKAKLLCLSGIFAT